MRGNDRTRAHLPATRIAARPRGTQSWLGHPAATPKVVMTARPRRKADLAVLVIARMRSWGSLGGGGHLDAGVDTFPELDFDIDGSNRLHDFRSRALERGITGFAGLRALPHRARHDPARFPVDADQVGDETGLLLENRQHPVTRKGDHGFDVGDSGACVVTPNERT